MKIRRAKSSEWNKFYKILNKTPELQVNVKEETYSKNWVKKVITDKKHNLFLVIEENNQIVGFLIAYYLLSVKHLFLIDLYIRPNYRRKGIASSLISECEKIAKKLGLKYSFGNVLVNNKKMQVLMEKFEYNQGGKWYFYGKRLK